MPDEKAELRAKLEAVYGQVWDTTQLQEDFEVLGFAYWTCIARRKSDGVRGTIAFEHSPRLYYNFVPSDR